MTTAVRSKRRLLLIGFTWAVVVAAMVGFAAEPSTSTQFDARQGRGVYVVKAVGTGGEAIVAAGGSLPPAVQVTVVLALLAALALVAAGGQVTTTGDRQRSRTMLRWARLARRGPPARA